MSNLGGVWEKVREGGRGGLGGSLREILQEEDGSDESIL